jgi:hypothetical protein
MAMFRCAGCGKINENALLCAYCECEVLVEFTLNDEDKGDEMDNACANHHHCPACGICLEIEALNCKIFRCGVTKSGQVGPHASLAEMQALQQNGEWVSGCGAPLRYREDIGAFEVIYDDQGNILYI